MSSILTAPGMPRVDDLAAFLPRLVCDWPRRAGGARHCTVDGTMLSADISGFTRLSEKLAGLGKQGAEELIGVINGCFDGMIDVAAALGGDVLKFGGDALLLLFTGPEHAARACDAAIGMRAVIAEPVQSPTAGRVQLRMSQGMHSGEFTFFLVDGGHDELIVTGPGVTETVRCEGAARAGEILLSPATATLVPGDWLAPPGPDGQRLKRRTPGASQYVDLADVGPELDEAALTRFVAGSQLDRVATMDGEHRHVAIAFIGFLGTDVLLAEGAVADVAARLQSLADVTRDACERFGVHWLTSDVYADGGKVILTAGAPRSLGDDEDALLRAVRQVFDGTDALPLRAGVNCGRVFAGRLGSRRRRTYTTMGDAMNLAARLMQKATRGEVVASRAVLDRAHSDFDVEELEPFHVKGKLVPIHAALVRATNGDDGRDHNVRLPLVGRAHELGVLDVVLDASAQVRAVVDVIGEPGIGKTRLVEELAARHHDLPLFVASCGRYARDTPYFAVRSLLRGLTGIPVAATPREAGNALRRWVRSSLPDIEPWLPLVAIPFDAEVPATAEAAEVAPAFRRKKVHELVIRVLDAVLPPRGILLVDEAQWIDEAAAALLVDLVADAEGRGWLVCVTRTPGPSPLDGVEASAVVELTPLGPDEAIALANAAAVPYPTLGRREIEALAARGGGHPLFTIQLVSAAAEHGSLDALPDSVETAVTARIDTLPAHDRRLLREAAVLGARVDLAVLRRVTGDRAVLRKERWAGVSEFVEWSGATSVRFRHALFQQVAYEGLPYARRRAVHRQVGEALEASIAAHGDDALELLSLHFHHAGDGTRAWRYSVKAGDDARRKFSNASARQFYERAVSHATAAEVAGEHLAAVHESLGDTCELDGLYERADAAYRAARRIADPAALPRLLRKQGELRERRGRYRDALRWYGRALTLLDGTPQPDPRHVETAIAYAGVRFRQGRYRECLRWAGEAARDAGTGGLDDERAHALYLLGVASIPLADANASDFLEEAIAIYERTGDLVGLANALNNLGVDAYFTGRWADALRWYTRSQDARERAGDVVGAAMSANNIAEILSDQGHHDDAYALLQFALREWRRATYPVGIALATGNLGRLEARRGDTRSALGLLDDALAAFESLGSDHFVVETRARRAEALLLAGEVDGALDEAERVTASPLTRAEPAMSSAAQRLVGVAQLRLGRLRVARERLDASVAEAERHDLRFELAQALTARARLGDRADEQRANSLFATLGVVAPVVP